MIEPIHLYTIIEASDSITDEARGLVGKRGDTTTGRVREHRR